MKKGLLPPTESSRLVQGCGGVACFRHASHRRRVDGRARYSTSKSKAKALSRVAPRSNVLSVPAAVKQQQGRFILFTRSPLPSTASTPSSIAPAVMISTSPIPPATTSISSMDGTFSRIFNVSRGRYSTTTYVAAVPSSPFSLNTATAQLLPATDCPNGDRWNWRTQATRPIGS